VLAELPSEVTVTAGDDLELVVVTPTAMFRLMGRTPTLSRQLGNLMETRRKTVIAARQLKAGI
jgi:CRP-like cAMP-binding protein